MKTVAVNVPDALLLHTSDEELARQSQFLLALKFFELGRVTSGQAAEMCGMNRVDFLVAASQTGTPVADLNEEELRREIRDATS
jgi:predicted HTH domain antitoxin